jgi:multimeric flavodoxin WrbA
MDKLSTLYKFLKSKKDSKILFLTTSNRWEGDKEKPKSSIIADKLKEKLKNCEIIDVSKLKIFPCEGNVSTKKGNTCGLKGALLENKTKNPHNFIRCWASINNKSDEMYIVANKIYESDIIILFGSIRWGKMNSIYATLIERLTWLENRHSTLGEDNILKDKMAGIVTIGQNWNGDNAVELEKEVLSFYGFKVPKELSFSWQYTNDKNDESKEGYKNSYSKFIEYFNFYTTLKESVIKFSDMFKK